jgi:hypothetical protein
MEKINQILWQAPEHIKLEKNEDWFWIIGIVSAGLVFLSIFFGNILLGLIILIGIGVTFAIANKPAEIIDFEINRKGVKINDTLYTYANLESFYIIDEDGYERDRLLIKSRKMFVPLLVLPIGNSIEHQIIYDFLIEYLNEEELREPTMQKMMQNLGF